MSICWSVSGRNSPLVKAFLGGTAFCVVGLGWLIVFCAEGLGWSIVFCGGADFLGAEVGGTGLCGGKSGLFEGCLNGFPTSAAVDLSCCIVVIELRHQVSRG